MSIARPPWPNAALAGIFGTGADGNVTISSGTTTITRDMHYRNLTVLGGTLNVNGFRVFVSETLTSWGGVIAGNGPIPTAAIGAVGGSASLTITGSTIPSGAWTQAQGGIGNITTGINPTQPFNGVISNGVGGRGGNSGNGGLGVSAGGTGLLGQTINSGPVLPAGPIQTFHVFGSRDQVGGLLHPGMFGAPGGQGGGDGTNAGGGGGGPGGPGCWLAIFARTIFRGASTVVGAFRANGADGGNGANGVGGTAGGGGGGGGGSGGGIYMVVGRLSGTAVVGALQANGGRGGDGGNSPSTNRGGDGGQGGGAGFLSVTQLENFITSVVQAFTAGVAGSTTVTPTGATGGAGIATTASL